MGKEIKHEVHKQPFRTAQAVFELESLDVANFSFSRLEDARHQLAIFTLRTMICRTRTRAVVDDLKDGL